MMGTNPPTDEIGDWCADCGREFPTDEIHVCPDDRSAIPVDPDDQYLEGLVATAVRNEGPRQGRK